MNTVNKTLLSIFAATSLMSAGGNIDPVIDETEVGANPWSYELQLYALAVWIQGNSEIGYRLDKLGIENSTPSSTVDVTPKDIFDNLKMGAMAHFEAHHDNGWGLWLDYVFMNLGPDVDLGKKILNIDNVGLYQGILEAFATYRVPTGKGYIDYFGGVRWWHNAFDLTLTANLPTPRTKSWSRDIDWYDPIIGAVWVTPINKNWSFRLRGDVGGFGIASNFTSAIEIGALYDIDEKWQVDLRFKSLWVDYEEGTEGRQDRFTYDTASFGPIIGITYRF